MNVSEFHKRLVKENRFPPYVKMPILIFSSWLFQGILYMDTTEKVFKILLDVLSFIPLYFVFRVYFYASSSTLIAVMLAHTLNWIFNGQLFVLLKNLKLTKTESKRFIQYLNDLKKRIEKENSILAAAAFGSLSREQLKETSDLDVRIIRKKGLINALRACLFVLLERMGSFFNKFPLDIYVLDGFKSLSKLNEQPILLHDSKSMLKEYYRNKGVLLWK